MIKMVLNNNCVIKMQIIASKRQRQQQWQRGHHDQAFATVISIALFFGSAFLLGEEVKKNEIRVAISKEDLLQNAFHSR